MHGWFVLQTYFSSPASSFLQLTVMSGVESFATNRPSMFSESRAAMSVEVESIPASWIAAEVGDRELGEHAMQQRVRSAAKGPAVTLATAFRVMGPPVLRGKSADLLGRR